MRTDYGILKLFPQAFYVEKIPSFEYEYPNHIYIYDEKRLLDVNIKQII